MRKGRIAHSTLIVLMVLSFSPAAGAEPIETFDFWSGIRAQAQQTWQDWVAGFEAVVGSALSSWTTAAVDTDVRTDEGARDDQAARATFEPDPDPGPVNEIFPQIEPGG